MNYLPLLACVVMLGLCPTNAQSLVDGGSDTESAVNPIILRVSDMESGASREKVLSAINEVEGVKSATVLLGESDFVRIVGTSPAKQLIKAVEEAGFRSKPTSLSNISRVSVGGEVNNPKTILFEGPTIDILKVIPQAGGHTPLSDWNKVKVCFARDKDKVMTLNLENLATLTEQFLIRPGDTILVPSISNFSKNPKPILSRVKILGEVKLPGTIKFKGTAPNFHTLISLAGGLTPLGNSKEIQVNRDGDDGKENTETVDISKVDSLTRPFLIHPEDVITVKTKQGLDVANRVILMVPDMQPGDRNKIVFALTKLEGVTSANVILGTSKFIRVVSAKVLIETVKEAGFKAQSNRLSSLSRVTMTGKVRLPGTVLFAGPTIDFLSIARQSGGTLPWGNLKNVLVRRNYGDNAIRGEIFTVNLGKLGPAGERFFVYPGDIIIVRSRMANPNPRPKPVFPEIYIRGEIKLPGTIKYIGAASVDLLTLIAISGGLTYYADPANVQIKRVGVDGKELTLGIDLDKLQTSMESFSIYPGDQVTVKPKLEVGVANSVIKVRDETKLSKVGVLGEVKAPGVIRFESATVDILQIIAQAKGLTELGLPEKVLVRRLGDNPKVFVVDIDKVRTSTEPFLIHSGDIITVQRK